MPFFGFPLVCLISWGEGHVEWNMIRLSVGSLWQQRKCVEAQLDRGSPPSLKCPIRDEAGEDEEVRDEGYRGADWPHFHSETGRR